TSVFSCAYLTVPPLFSTHATASLCRFACSTFHPITRPTTSTPSSKLRRRKRKKQYFKEFLGKSTIPSSDRVNDARFAARNRWRRTGAGDSTSAIAQCLNSTDTLGANKTQSASNNSKANRFCDDDRAMEA